MTFEEFMFRGIQNIFGAEFDINQVLNPEREGPIITVAVTYRITALQDSMPTTFATGRASARVDFLVAIHHDAKQASPVASYTLWIRFPANN
jgi:hypothetical protein